MTNFKIEKYWHYYLMLNIIMLIILGVIEIFAWDTGQLGILSLIHKSEKWYWAYIFWFLFICPMASAFIYSIAKPTILFEDE